MRDRADIARFAIGFDERDRPRLHALWDQVIGSQRWSEGPLTERFEQAWSAHNGLAALAFGSWTGGALAALEFAGVRGETVLCPSNTFMATPLSVLQAGGRVTFVDNNRTDLCMSFEDFQRKAEETRPKGAWGDAGAYSFYATKTVSTGEGGVLVSRHDDLLTFARGFRNYGKPGYDVQGLNFRLSEFTAALGLVQTDRLDEIVAFKNAAAREQLDPQHPNRVELPAGMLSGLYKYIVFDPIEKSTGKVYDQPCHRIMGHHVELPNADWVAEHHWCVPLYYRPARTPAEPEVI